MSYIWKHQLYSIYGFLIFSMIIFIIISSELSIIFIYLYLCKGDYNWWWKSFIIGGSSSIYFIGYSVFYFIKLDIVRLSTTVIYYGLMTLITSLIFFISGSIAVLSTFIFLHKIYSLIKID